MPASDRQVETGEMVRPRLVSDWRQKAGDKMRGVFQEAIAAAGKA